MTHLYLIRHGTAASVSENDHTRELGLSPEGVEQVEHLRARIAAEIRPDVLIASPLQRARETAEALAPDFGLLPVIDSDLQEWRSDPDNLLTEDDFNARWRETSVEQKPFFRFVPGGETWLEFSVRVQQTLNRLLQEHASKTIVLVTHGGVIQASLAYFFGFSPAVLPRASVDLKQTGITHWYERDGRWVLERFNDYHHLQPN